MIILPKKLRDSKTEGMSLFLDRYERYLSAFQYTCSNCSTLCGETGNANWVGRDDIYGDCRIILAMNAWDSTATVLVLSAQIIYTGV